MQLDATGRIAILHVDSEMTRVAGGTYEDTDGLINLPLSVKEIEAAVFFEATRRRRMSRQHALERRYRHRRGRKGVRRRRPQERRRMYVRGTRDALQKLFVEKIGRAIDLREVRI